MAARQPDFASAFANSYERMCGGCTSLVATEIISDLNQSAPISSTSYILDNACGTGVMTTELKRRYPDAKILATDVNQTMIDEVRRRIQQNGWADVETDDQDVRTLDHVQSETLSHVLTNFGILVPGDEAWAAVKALREMYRVLKTGGVAAVSNWADRVWPIAFTNAAKTIRPDDDIVSPIAVSEIYMRGSWLISQFEQAGFGNNVHLKQYITYTSADSLDNLVDNMMLAKMMFFKGFDDDEMERVKPILREELQKLRTFKVHDDGSVSIGMKAWIAYGYKKGDEKEVPL